MRGGYRRRFSEADERRILEEAARPGASLAQIARRYGIARRVLCRWKQELTPVFVAVQITVAAAKSGAVLPLRSGCHELARNALMHIKALSSVSDDSGGYHPS
jgi:hypothetical protein